MGLSDLTSTTTRLFLAIAHTKALTCHNYRYILSMVRSHLKEPLNIPLEYPHLIFGYMVEQYCKTM